MRVPYRRFPTFWPLRGAVAIIDRGGIFLVVEHSDGSGLGFPGELARPWESGKQAFARKFLDETGLRVTSQSWAKGS
jgi:ADP-ribose pyrophosphatase YjhB (NUDIX family)